MGYRFFWQKDRRVSRGDRWLAAVLLSDRKPTYQPRITFTPESENRRSELVRLPNGWVKRKKSKK